MRATLVLPVVLLAACGSPSVSFEVTLLTKGADGRIKEHTRGAGSGMHVGTHVTLTLIEGQSSVTVTLEKVEGGKTGFAVSWSDESQESVELALGESKVVFPEQAAVGVRIALTAVD